MPGMPPPGMPPANMPPNASTAAPGSVISAAPTTTAAQQLPPSAGQTDALDAAKKVQPFY